MKTKTFKLLAFFLILLNLKIANANSCIALFSEQYPTEIKTIELNNSLKKLQNGEVVEVMSTLPNEKVGFYVTAPNSTNKIFIEGSLVGVTTLANGKPALNIDIPYFNSGEALIKKMIFAVERIVPNSITVSPIISEAQARASAVEILAAYKKGEQITFKQVSSGQIVDSPEVGRIDEVVTGPDGFVERFYMTNPYGLSTTKKPEIIVPGSIRVLEILPRRLSQIESELFQKLQTAQQRGLKVTIELKSEHQVDNWAPGRANRSVGIIKSINLVSGGEWVISIFTISNKTITYRLQEIAGESFQVSQPIGLGGLPETLKIGN